eukprot:scaffold4832_cov115-Skeletonema_dohrnii-CCMP3373.AAC.3
MSHANTDISMSGSQRRFTTLETMSSSSTIINNEASESAKRRWSTLGLSVRASANFKASVIKAKLHEHCDIEYKPEECEITPNRLAWARKNMVVHRRTSCALAAEEKDHLVKEQQCIKSLLVTGEFEEESEYGESEEDSSEVDSEDGLGGIQESIEEEEEDEEVETQQQQRFKAKKQGDAKLKSCEAKCKPPQDNLRRERSFSTKLSLRNIRAKLIKLKLRSRHDMTNDGVLGVQAEEEDDDDDDDDEVSENVRQRSSILMDSSISSTLASSRRPHNSILMNSSISSSQRVPSRQRTSIILPPTYRRCSRPSINYRGSLVDEEFVKYNMNMKKLQFADDMKEVEEEGEEKDEEDGEMDVEYVDYVRKPDLANIIEQYDALANHPKYS